jgi:hypothetical protein
MVRLGLTSRNNPDRSRNSGDRNSHRGHHVARRWRQANAARLAPSGLIDFLFVADREVSRRLRRHEDRVTHFPAGTMVLDFNFLPEPKASMF